MSLAKGIFLPALKVHPVMQDVSDSFDVANKHVCNVDMVWAYVPTTLAATLLKPINYTIFLLTYISPIINRTTKAHKLIDYVKPRAYK